MTIFVNTQGQADFEPPRNSGQTLSKLVSLLRSLNVSLAPTPWGQS